MSSTANNVEVAVYQQKKLGETYCGDSYFYAKSNNQFICVVADGLGSGKYAAESSQVVINIVKENMTVENDQLIKKINEKLIGKRGIVLGILKLDFNAHIYRFSSIGNVGIIVVTGDQKKKRNLPSTGYLAGYHRNFKVLQDNLENEMNFIMFSDGVSDKELSKNYITNKDVNEVVKLFSYLNGIKRNDDTTLIAVRYDNHLNEH